MNSKKNIIIFVILITLIIGFFIFFYGYKKNKKDTENKNFSLVNKIESENNQPVSNKNNKEIKYLKSYYANPKNRKKPIIEDDIDENIDSDGDSITDVEEVKLGTSPYKTDTDGDKISDGDEINLTKTNPLKKDTDGDGYDDLTELRAGYNPNGDGKLIKD